MGGLQSRQVAERASSVRAMLDLREHLRQRRLLCGGIFFLAVIAPNALRGILTPHIGVTLGWVVCWTLVLAVVAASLQFHRVRRRRLSEARARMLCPRCRYVLREDGPNAWTTCDDTPRICTECAFAVTDDVYAAAALPGVRERAEGLAAISPGALLGGALIIAVFFAGFGLVGIAGRRVFGDIGWFVALLGVPLAAALLLFALAFRVQRHADAFIASWPDSPWCPACDAPLPAEAANALLVVCGECGGRVSPPAALAEARRAARGDRDDS